MPATSLKVSILSVTPDAEALIYAACKQCTSQDDADDVFSLASNTDNASYSDHTSMAQESLIRRVIDSGHLSVTEHVSFSFAVSGVSRALSHQLVRHRIASYSQQSQRYVKEDEFEYVVPDSCNRLENMSAVHVFSEAMNAAKTAYAKLLKLGIPAEDARFVLPNACETKLVVTMNARSLLHFFEQRCCMRSQWEIRALANEMLRLCKDAVPVLFEKAGARCERKGFCEEEKGCGRAPRLKDVMEKYREDAPCA